MVYFIKRHNKVFSLIISWFGVFSLLYMVKVNNSLAISNSIISLLLYILFTYVINSSIKIIDKRLLIYSYLFGLAFSVMLNVGTRFYLYDSMHLDGKIEHISFLISILGASFLFTSLLSLLAYKLPLINQQLLQLKFENKVFCIFKPNKLNFLIIWLIIFVSWLPAFLISFPGSYAYDGIYQINQIRLDHQLVNNHPILHTLYLYACIIGGQKVFGTYVGGMALYSITQMLINSAIFAYTCYFIAKKNTPIIIRIFTLLFFTLLPLHSMFAINATKDVIFSGLLLLMILFTIDMVMEKEKFFISWKLQLRYIVTAFLMFAFRNNGVYLFAFCVPFFIWFANKKRIRMTILCMLTLALYFTYTGPVMSMLHVKQPGFGVTLGAPLQMMARAVKENSSILSKEELDAIYEVLPTKTSTIYASRISDPITARVNRDVRKNDLTKYIKVWISVGLKCPGSYISALISNNFGNWYPDMNYPDPFVKQAYIEYNMKQRQGNYLLIERQSLFPNYVSFYENIAYKGSHQQIPVISMLFNPGFYFWFLLVCIFVLLYKKKYSLLLPLSLLIGLWCTLMLGPVVLLRYTYPIIVASPIFLMLISKASEEE